VTGVAEATGEQLFEAIRAGDAATARAMLATRPVLANAPDESGIPPLLMATYYGRDEIAVMLLGAGAAVDVFAAAARGLTERLALLLDAGPGLANALSADGWTPLHLAAHFGQPAAAELLVARGANVRARSRNLMANTPLHAALAGRRRDLAELLLSWGADVNASQRGGWTALHQAVDHADAELVALLLRHGADPSRASDDGRTPLALARADGLHEIAGQLT
jgi:ankyrin repeat protein